MNYPQDGRCEISNNAAERRVKSYVMGRKNFLFHNTVDGARASATVLEKKCLSPAKKQVRGCGQFLDLMSKDVRRKK